MGDWIERHERTAFDRRPARATAAVKAKYLLHTTATQVALATALPFRRRSDLLRWLGWDVHETTMIERGVCFFGGRGIHAGPGAVINVGAMLDGTGVCTIEEGAGIGAGTIVLTAEHEVGPRQQRFGKLVPMNTRIGSGAWIGAGVTVRPGTIVGAGSVVAAGAVVVHDVRPDTLVAGVPAREIRSL